MTRTAGEGMALLSRRGFIWIAGSGTAAILVGCSSSDTSSRIPGSTSGGGLAGAPDLSQLNGFLRELRDAIRTSPDHLSARAEAIVARRDPLEAVRFVRDEIAVLPSGFPTTAASWGPRATLRAGAGTLRERSEVLAGMLAVMGIDARVREIDRPSAMTAMKLWRPRPHAFEPDPAKLRPLFSKAGITPPRPAAFGVDHDAERAIKEMADALLSRMPSAARRASRTAPRDLPDRIPVVEYSAGGRRVIAVAAGDLDVLGTVSSEPRDPGVMQVPAVDVVVSVALNPPVGSTLDPSRTYEVLRASWPADHLAGRRLTLTFPVPGEKIHAPDGREPGPCRVPLLRVSDGKPIPDSVKQVVTGDMISLSGGVFRADPSDSKTTIGAFGPLTLAPRRDDLAASVASLTASVTAATFPDIDLRVSVRDAGNKPVNGLAATDFVVTEDGRPQSAFVLSDTAPSLPRVLVVYDGSMSATEIFRTPQIKRDFDHRIATALVDASSSSPFVTQVIAIGGAATESGWLPPEADRIAGGLQVITTSDIWQTLGEAVPASGAGVAILVSDNEATDDPRAIPTLRARLKASGIPIISVPVGAKGKEHTDDIVAASGGEAVDPRDPALARSLAKALHARLTGTPPQNYRMRYRSDRPASDAKPRKVSVTLAAKRAVTAATSYTLPPAEDRLVPPGIAGIYVSITVNGVTEVRRLGGVDVSYRGTPDRNAIDARAIEEAADVVRGITTIAFEPPNPSAGEMLDDMITAVIGLEPVLQALPNGDAALSAQASHIRRVPALFSALFEPVGGDSDAVATGLRTAILIESPGPSPNEGTRTVITALDVVPAHNRVLGVGDPADAFRAAMTASLTASYRETKLSSASAASRLARKPLTYLAPFATYDERAPGDVLVSARRRTLLARYADMHRFVATDVSVAALWIVDPATGSAIAIDDAGRGGAVMEARGAALRCETPFQLIALLDFAALLISTLCTISDQVESVPAKVACIGANVEGVAALVYGSYTHPAGSPPTMSAAAGIATVVGAGIGLKDAAQGIRQWKSPSPTHAAERAVLAVIGLMLYGISSASDCHPDTTTPPEPSPQKPGPTCSLPSVVSCQE
ncbi:MAG TPA: hypothetical protein VIG08_11530 [Gemmatimonadales bacterium]